MKNVCYQTETFFIGIVLLVEEQRIPERGTKEGDMCPGLQDKKNLSNENRGSK